MKRAVIYVRVSSKEQAEGGYSLDAQLEVCRRFVTDKGWLVAGEYVDRGESARTADRPQFQEMLNRLSNDKSVSYVVVHKLDRLARNLEDHVTVRARLKKVGIVLVSATEALEETPSGKLVEGILASIAEFYSANLSQEVRKGMLQKVRNGGWPTIAPLGYLNVRSDGGRKAESRLVPDPVMGPLVREAFELYASGECSLSALHTTMAQRGLRTSRGLPIVRSKFALVLKNPIYIGTVRWGGIESVGTHEPLVSHELFERVQRVFRLHDKAGVRERKHPHYLKGAVYCATCGSRLSLTVAKGRFTYFFCVGRSQRRTECREAYVPADELERQVEALYSRIHFPEEARERIRESMDKEIAAQVLGGTKLAERHSRRLAQLANEREKLLRAYYAEAISVEMLKAEQARIDTEVAALQQQIDVDLEKLEQARDLVEGAMRLAGNSHESYLAAEAEARRHWNGALFKRILVGGRQVSAAEYREPFRTLFSWAGSNKEFLVGRRGFEP